MPVLPVGSLDDHSARSQQSFLLRIADDEKRCTVLDRLTGIEEFGFAENGAACRL